MEVLGRYGDRGDSAFRLPSTRPSEFLEKVERLGLTGSSEQANFKRDVCTKGKVAHTWKGDERDGVWSRGVVVVNMKGKNPGLSAIRGQTRFRGAESSLNQFPCSCDSGQVGDEEHTLLPVDGSAMLSNLKGRVARTGSSTAENQRSWGFAPSNRPGESKRIGYKHVNLPT